ncbi:tetratricopeptide repeat protein [Lentzea sp. HUAS TT2]|uniref:tetratricopeptide repeat protein n=1 Tax=Lentzea sp. HUAS TT2 TaxID=3447454 RepID=UPI003F70A2FF
MLSQRYTDRAEIRRVLSNADIGSANLRSDLSPAVTWHEVLTNLTPTPASLKRLLESVQADYPDEPLVVEALWRISGEEGANESGPLAEAQENASSRSKLSHWLRNEWLTNGPNVCCVQGFSGVGKSFLADKLIIDSGLPSALIEVPTSRMQFDDATLVISEFLDRDLGVRIPLGGDFSNSLIDLLRSQTLLVIDDFQNCLDDSGRMLPGYEELVSRLRPSRHRGRILLLSSRAVLEEELEHVQVRTLPSFDTSEGIGALTRWLAESGRQAEVPHDRMEDVVSWLGGNARALKTLVASLRKWPLDELINLSPASWEMRGNRISQTLVRYLETQLVRKTLSAISEHSQDALQRISVYRRSFNREQILAQIQSSLDSAINDLEDNFLIERRRRWYSMNPVAREVAAAKLRKDGRRLMASHRVAADYYMRPFKARRTTPGRNAANFIEARYHLTATGDEHKLADISQLYSLHLERVYKAETQIPLDADEISEQCAVLEGALSAGSPSAGMHVYLAKLYLARNRNDDTDRAANELINAAILPRCPKEAWLTLLRLGRTASVQRLIADNGPALDLEVFLLLGRLLFRSGRLDEAVAALIDGTKRLKNPLDSPSLYEAAAKMLNAAGKSTDAIDLLRAGIEQLREHPGTVLLYRQISETLVRQGRHDEAVQITKNGVNDFGNSPESLALRIEVVRILRLSGRHADELQKVSENLAKLEGVPNSADLYTRVSKILVDVGLLDTAVHLLRSGIDSLQAHSGAVGLCNAAGTLLANAGRTSEALDLISKGAASLRAHPNVASLYRHTSDLMIAVGRADEVLLWLDDSRIRLDLSQITSTLSEIAGEVTSRISRADAAAADIPKIPLGNNEEGQARLRESVRILVAGGRISEAIQLLRQGITALDTGSAMCMLYLDSGRVLASSGLLNNAVSILKEGIIAVGAVAGVSHLYHEANSLLFANGRFEEAVSLLREGVINVPMRDASILYHDLGELLIATGRADEALDLWLQAIDQLNEQPGVSFLYHDASTLLIARGAPDKAMQLLRKGIAEHAPEDLSALYHDLGELLIAAGRIDEALDLWLQAIDQLNEQPGVSFLYHDASTLLIARGAPDKAMQLLRKGIAEHAPEDLSALYHDLGELLIAAGRMDEALDLWLQAIDQLNEQQGVEYLVRDVKGMVALLPVGKRQKVERVSRLTEDEEAEAD